MLGYFCIGFIYFMLKRKSLLEYTNLFCPHEYKNNDKEIIKCFQQNLNKLNSIAMFTTNKENLKKTKISHILKKKP